MGTKVFLCWRLGQAEAVGYAIPGLESAPDYDGDPRKATLAVDNKLAVSSRTRLRK